MEHPQPAEAATAAEPRRRGERPPRRRRSALLGGGALIASSPVTVGAGMFVPGFAALGLGALLLLLPPRPRRARRRMLPLRAIGRPAAAGGRAGVALARGTARAGGHVFWALERFAATSGRDGAVRIGVATFDRAGAVGRAARGAGLRGWSSAQVAAPRVWRRLAATAVVLARAARSASLRTWVRVRPVLRRAWVACRAGLARATHQLAGLGHLASERLSAYVDSRTGSR